jgi:hypothetical protein
MIKTRGLIGIILFVAVGLMFVIGLLVRAKRKSGIISYLKKQHVNYDQLIIAHESEHYIAIQNEAAQFHLLKYSKKKKAFQLKTFNFSDVQTVDFYLDGKRIFSMNDTAEPENTIHLKPNNLNRNLVSVRLYLKGIEYPYIMSLDQFAEGNGSTIANNGLVKNVNDWQVAFSIMLYKKNL